MASSLTLGKIRSGGTSLAAKFLIYIDRTQWRARPAHVQRKNLINLTASDADTFSRCGWIILCHTHDPPSRTATGVTRFPAMTAGLPTNEAVRPRQHLHPATHSRSETARTLPVPPNPNWPCAPRSPGVPQRRLINNENEWRARSKAPRKTYNGRVRPLPIASWQTHCREAAALLPNSPNPQRPCMNITPAATLT